MKLIATGGVLLLLAVCLVSWYATTYNRFVKLDEQAKAAWAQVENQLQRRYDLIPNLVNTVKGYAQHEEKVLVAVTEARSHVGSARTINEKIGANGELSSALSRLLVVSEKYPDLKANQNFLDLQSQLEGTENRIAVERKRYNDAVMEFNTAIRGIAGQLVARAMKLERKLFFQAQAPAQKAPEVHF